MSASRIAPESYSPATATGEKNTLREEGDVGAGEEARTLDLKLGKLDGAHVLQCIGGDNGVAAPLPLTPLTSPDAAKGPSCAAELQPSYSAKKPDTESLSPLANELRKEAMKRTPMRRRSKKMAKVYRGTAEVEGRASLVGRLLKERPRCEVVIRGRRCPRRSVDIHELLARSAGGSILDVTNLLATCRICHTWIGDHPQQALAFGLRRSRYAGRNPTPNTTETT